MKLVFQLHPDRYSTDVAKVGLIGTLLSGTALAWFAPLLEKGSPLLHDFGEFEREFKECFDDTDSLRTAVTKIRKLTQGSKPASTYAAEFCQLACDIPWDDAALMEQFRWGLRNDVKDLLLTMEDPRSLSEAISQAIRCDNQLFERRAERRLQGFQSSSSMSPVLPNQHQAQTGPEPMQIDAFQCRGPLTEEEKQRRRRANLCLYCGNPGHQAMGCPNKRNRLQAQGTIAIQDEEPLNE